MLSGADLGNFFRIMAIIVTEGPPIDSVPLTPLNEKFHHSPIYMWTPKCKIKGVLGRSGFRAPPSTP